MCPVGLDDSGLTFYEWADFFLIACAQAGGLTLRVQGWLNPSAQYIKNNITNYIQLPTINIVNSINMLHASSTTILKHYELSLTIDQPLIITY